MGEKAGVAAAALPMTEEDEIRHRGPPGAGKRPIREPALAAGRGAESEDRPQTQALGTALPGILAKLYEKVGLQHRAQRLYEQVRVMEPKLGEGQGGAIVSDAAPRTR